MAKKQCVSRQGPGGATVAIYGAGILLTDHAARSDRRAFRRTKDAGLYYLCFSLALILIVLSNVSNEHHQSLLAAGALIGAERWSVWQPLTRGAAPRSLLIWPC
jgi:hypothetical protein